MFKLDIDKVRELHGKYSFALPLLDAGGLANPTIADYEISRAKAIPVMVTDNSGTAIAVKVPHSVQTDRYLSIVRPWSFIDPGYLILNPENGDPCIEALPAIYPQYFGSVILVSVFEHVENPYTVSDALFRILKPGGLLFNSAPFLFPYHGAPEDNWRYAAQTLRRIHEASGFEWIDGGWHVNYSSGEGIGTPAELGVPQAIVACYALCRKPA